MAVSWIRVKVHPRAAKEVLIQTGPGRFEAWISAKPIEGKANEALFGLLYRSLNIPAGHLKLIKGGIGRNKVFQIL